MQNASAISTQQGGRDATSTWTSQDCVWKLESRERLQPISSGPAQENDVCISYLKKKKTTKHLLLGLSNEADISIPGYWWELTGYDLTSGLMEPEAPPTRKTERPMARHLLKAGANRTELPHSPSAWPRSARTCDQGRRLLVGLFKHHWWGAEGDGSLSLFR